MNLCLTKYSHLPHSVIITIAHAQVLLSIVRIVITEVAMKLYYAMVLHVPTIVKDEKKPRVLQEMFRVPLIINE